MDYGKYRYEQTKRVKEQHKHQVTAKLKEIRLRPLIEQHDYEVKLHQARDFLEKRYKVRLSMRFRGREIVHKNRGIGLLNKFLEDLKDCGAQESPMKTLGKLLLLTIGPTAKQKAKKKEKEKGKEK